MGALQELSRPKISLQAAGQDPGRTEKLINCFDVDASWADADPGSCP